jgi:hypothetical protein
MNDAVTSAGAPPDAPGELKRLGQSIGAAVREAFERSPGRREDMTECADSVLRTHPEIAGLRPRRVLDRLCAGGQDIANLQFGSRFSDLQLMLHVEDDFVVQLLFWTNATTSIHDHFFAGAFRVVEGSSLHCNYRFDQAGGAGAFGWGRLELVDAELLHTGDVRTVHFAPRTIHSVFHLEVPSVSLLIASSLVHPGERQREYVGGRLAVDMAVDDHLLTKRLQALKIVAATSPLLPHLEIFLRGADARSLHACLVALDPEISRLDDGERGEVERVVRKHPQAEPVLAAVRTEKVVSRLMLMRRRMRDPLARFVLAMIVNVPEPERWPDLLARRAGASASTGLAAALAELFDDPFWTLVTDEEHRRRFAGELQRHLAGDPASLERLRLNPLAGIVFPFEPAPVARQGA